MRPRGNRAQTLSASGRWPAPDNTVSCMSCHKAHGNRNPFGLLKMGENTRLRLPVLSHDGVVRWWLGFPICLLGCRPATPRLRAVAALPEWPPGASRIVASLREAGRWSLGYQIRLVFTGTLAHARPASRRWDPRPAAPRRLRWASQSPRPRGWRCVSSACRGSRAPSRRRRAARRVSRGTTRGNPARPASRARWPCSRTCTGRASRDAPR